jgi:hypothetical protein
MFSAIYRNDIAQLSALGGIINSHDDNKPAALLCFDHTFRDLNRKTPIAGSDTQIFNRTRALCEYAELVQNVHSVLEPWSNEKVQKLFSFTVHSGDRVRLRRGTFLRGFFERSLRQSLSNEDAMVEVRSFYNMYQSSLQQRVKERLEAYCNASLSVRVFDPCEVSAASATGRCDRKECERQHNLDYAWFNKRLHFHMFQISILGSLRNLSSTMESGPVRRFDPFFLSTRNLHSLSTLKHLARATLRRHVPITSHLWVIRDYYTPRQPTNFTNISLAQDILDLAHALSLGSILAQVSVDVPELGGPGFVHRQ